MGRTTEGATTTLGLLLALTFSTGVIDAVGYLGLDRVFTGNMTGNVVILGMALTGAADLPVVGPVVALAGFMAGAAAGGRALRGVAAGWTPRTTWLLTSTALLILAAAVATVAADEHTAPVQAVVTTTLGVAMGVQAAAARHLAVKDVTTVVVTSTLTGLAADSWLGARTGQRWRRRAGAVVLIGAGAAAGALLLLAHIALGMLLPFLITLTVALVGHRGAQRPGPEHAAAAGPAHPLTTDQGSRL
ncbi:DUF1275 family protein [Georgenia sp. AZ-5]|uniref:DUF1275 family protein n=1 Tax=Georgenia sp. AZ-5 TaxID=3367526 RepID=UPI003754567D